MKILSLFDGMACGMIAMLGVTFVGYMSEEKVNEILYGTAVQIVKNV